MKLTASLLITFITIYVVFASLATTSPKASNPKAMSPCYDSKVDFTPTTTGCNTITKVQPTDVYFKDGHVAHFSQGPSTGGCGEDTTTNACPTCGTYIVGTKECWPRFLPGCPGNYQDSDGCWVGTWGRSVVNQTANQGTEFCCGVGKPKTTCADTTSDWYSVEHTCRC